MFSTRASSFKRKLFSIALLASLGCVALPASATVSLIVENGILMGANNVNVDGMKYDVRFVEGSYNSLFYNQPPSDFFGSSEKAYRASAALLDQVFIDSISGAFDTQTGLTNGCSGGFRCRAITPYATEYGKYVIGNFAGNERWDEPN